ncbi:MAG: hypothetical protein U0359_21275 [Byssovorax sp.]
MAKASSNASGMYLRSTKPIDVDQRDSSFGAHMIERAVSRSRPSPSGPRTIIPCASKVTEPPRAAAYAVMASRSLRS